MTSPFSTSASNWRSALASRPSFIVIFWAVGMEMAEMWKVDGHAEVFSIFRAELPLGVFAASS